MKVIHKVKINGKNWNELFNLPCVSSIRKDWMWGGDKVLAKPYVVLRSEAYDGDDSFGIGYIGDIICELENHKWFVQNRFQRMKGVGFGNSVKIKLDGGIMPKKESTQAAGYDLFCPMDYAIKPGRQVIPLKFSILMQEDMKADIRPRSGQSTKGFKVMYCDPISLEEHEERIEADVLLGTIDADYRDGVGVIIKVTDPKLQNSGHLTPLTGSVSWDNVGYYIPKGCSIAQMVFSKVPSIDFQVVDELDKTVDRGGGFGHSDENLKAEK